MSYLTPTTPNSHDTKDMKQFYTEEEAQRWLERDESHHISDSERCSSSEKPIILSGEQEKILQLVKRGGNVFFTGPAGSGKSVLLRAIISALREAFPSGDSVAVTATTGVAAIAIGGQTVHSYAGIGLGTKSAEQLLKDVKDSVEASIRWSKTRVWIIDEISMMDAQLFDKIEYIARAMKKNTHPFGGIQLILAGDFFQLPPVDKKYELKSAPATYAFKAKSWNKCIAYPHFLRQVFRQKSTGSVYITAVSSTFIDILSAIRMGTLSRQHEDRLRDLERPLIINGGTEPAMLFPTHTQVNQYNNDRLNKLNGSLRVYRAMDSAGHYVLRQPVPITDALAKLSYNMLAPAEIGLKVGAQVMLIQNVVQGVLVNGSIGKVVRFLTIREACEQGIRITNPSNQHPGGGFNVEDIKGQPPFTQRPFVEDRIFQLYETIPDLATRSSSLRAINTDCFSISDRWPLVYFPHGERLLCAPMNFDHMGFIGNIEARRLQVPLILAWAITMHKSQGQTLNHVRVDFNRIFTKGQAYVALSRATSLEGLQIMNFNPCKLIQKFCDGIPIGGIGGSNGWMIIRRLGMPDTSIPETLKFHPFSFLSICRPPPVLGIGVVYDLLSELGHWHAGFERGHVRNDRDIDASLQVPTH